MTEHRRMNPWIYSFLFPKSAPKSLIAITKEVIGWNFSCNITNASQTIKLILSTMYNHTPSDDIFTGKYQRFGTVGMLCRIMVATTLLYDHLHYQGVFVKDSPICIKLVVDILEEEAGLKRKRTRSRIDTPPGVKTSDEETRERDRDSLQDLQDQCRNLLSVLKYSNKHLKANTTPRSVEQLFSQIF